MEIYILLGLLILIGLYFMSTYNKIISTREFVKNSMGNIAAQVESRWDAIKVLIDATKNYSQYESDLLKDITAKRSGVNNNSNPSDIEKDNELFKEALGKINMVVENYPSLKADSLYIKAMDSINTYEDNVRTSRMVYNDTVTKYNRIVLQFPSSLVAKIFSFHEKDYFQLNESKNQMPSW